MKYSKKEKELRNSLKKAKRKKRKVMESILKSGTLITIVMAVVFREEMAKRTVKALQEHANFPHIFKMIISPKLPKLISWAKGRGIEVIPIIYEPIVRMKAACVKLCKTKYLFMVDSDVLIKNDLKPVLDFMESHKDVGVCALGLEGKFHQPLRYGQYIGRKMNIIFLRPFREQFSDYHYVDYVHNGATFFRKEMFKSHKGYKDVCYDIAYKGQGYNHIDLFMQLRDTKWKVVNCNVVLAEILEDESKPEWYKVLRRKNKYLNRKRFHKKWGLWIPKNNDLESFEFKKYSTEQKVEDAKIEKKMRRKERRKKNENTVFDSK